MSSHTGQACSVAIMMPISSLVFFSLLIHGHLAVAVSSLAAPAALSTPLPTGADPRFQAFLVGSFVTQTSLSVHYEIVKPALDLAIAEANRRYPAIAFHLAVKNDSNSCFLNVAGGLVAEQYYRQKAHAFIGPACDLALDQVARMASYWRVPLFTAGGFGATFADKSIYTTLTRLAFSLDRVSHFFIQIFKENDWHHVSLIIDESDMNMLLVRQSFEYMFKVESELNGYEIKVDVQSFNSKYATNATLDYSPYLKQAAQKARGKLINQLKTPLIRVLIKTTL